MINGVIGFGESVIDLIPAGTADGCILYKACPGGSVANLCVVVARQGVQSAFIGGVGQDSFGRFLAEKIGEYGVDTSSMVYTEDCGTNLTFVEIGRDGERSYLSVNKPGADKMVGYADIDIGKILEYKVLHVSSNAMAFGKTRDAQPRLLERAKASGMMISYDVNYRPVYYASEKEALETLRIPLQYADIVKVTEEELEFLNGDRSHAAAEKLLAGGARIVLVTKGRAGNDFYFAEGRGHVEACSVKAVDTTGAGDNFFGGFLSWMLREGNLDHPTEEELQKACIYANKVAALSILKTGAMSSVPTRDEVNRTDF